jgi:G3E family GTPase
MAKKIPITLITGFLGSGKTTIIQNAVKSIWDKKKVAIIKNEISDLSVDALEFDNSKLNITELPNGCICCTLVGALNESLQHIIKEYSPEHIFIEASGLAKPAQIVIALDLVEQVYIDSVIVVLDALNYQNLKEIDKAWSSQIQRDFIDLYILNKVDQISFDDIDNIKDEIFGIHPSARIIETNDAKVPAEVLLGSDYIDLLRKDYTDFNKVETDDMENHNEEGWEFFVVENFRIENIEILKKYLEGLPKSIYRIKGFFQFQNVNYIVNVVGGKANFRVLEKELPKENKVVFIGKNIERYRKIIQGKMA